MNSPIRTVATLEDTEKFLTLNGLWTGKKPPFVSATVIRNTNFTARGDIDYSDVAVLEVEARQLASRQLEPGDIVIERSGGGPKQPVGRVVYFDREDGPFSFSNFTSAIRIRDHKVLAPRFVFYRLLELYRSGGTEDIQRFTTGIRNLDFAAYKQRSAVPLLPLSEQEGVVALLDLVRSAVATQVGILDLALALKSTLLIDFFSEGLRREPLAETEVGPLPASWRVAAIGSIAKLRSGGTPSRTKPEYWDDGDIPWVKTAEVDNCIITSTDEHITAAGLAGSSAKLFPAGTLLMAMYGQGVTRAKVGLLGIEAATNQACAAFFPDPKIISSEYLYYLFQSKYAAIREYGHGANQKNLSGEIIKGIKIGFSPDEAEQKQTVAILKQIDERIQTARSTVERLEALFDSLLRLLMSGQNPEDATAVAA